MSADTHSKGQQLRLNLHVYVIGLVYTFILIFPVCVKHHCELCHQLLESDVSPAKLLGAQSLLGGGPGRRVVTAGDCWRFPPHRLRLGIFSRQRGELVAIGSGRRGTGGSAVEHLYLGAVTVISLKGMVD